MNQHTTTNCPQRSMAWLTVDEYDQIISATKEMIQLLDYDPTNQYLDSIWKPVESDQSYHIVSTVHSLRTLCICEHVEHKKRILICTDITDLNHMYNKRHNTLSITRLTMYGTIEAAFQSQAIPSSLSVGQPMMRYIHSDDVQEFCAGLNEANKSSCIVSFRLRMMDNDDDNESFKWSEFTVMTIEGGRKILCLIKPSTTPITETTTTTTTIVQQPQRNNNVLQETVTQMQTKFWYAIEHGMTLAARSLAASLVLIIQTVWQIWYDKDNSNKSWSGLFATSSEYVLRKVVKCTKERPEIETLCRLVSWTGIISQSTSRSFIDRTLDQTTEWLISKALFDGGNDMEYDAVI